MAERPAFSPVRLHPRRAGRCVHGHGAAAIVEHLRPGQLRTARLYRSHLSDRAIRHAMELQRQQRHRAAGRSGRASAGSRRYPGRLYRKHGQPEPDLQRRCRRLSRDLQGGEERRYADSEPEHGRYLHRPGAACGKRVEQIHQRANYAGCRQSDLEFRRHHPTAGQRDLYRRRQCRTPGLLGTRRVRDTVGRVASG